jgi:hypothetical protein
MWTARSSVNGGSLSWTDPPATETSVKRASRPWNDGFAARAGWPTAVFRV